MSLFSVAIEPHLKTGTVKNRETKPLLMNIYPPSPHWTVFHKVSDFPTNSATSIVWGQLSFSQHIWIKKVLLAKHKYIQIRIINMRSKHKNEPDSHQGSCISASTYHYFNNYYSYCLISKSKTTYDVYFRTVSPELHFCLFLFIVQNCCILNHKGSFFSQHMAK